MDCHKNEVEKKLDVPNIFVIRPNSQEIAMSNC